MSLCQITLSANAGAAVRLGGVRIWVDALHTEPVSGFSSVSPELFSAVMEHPDFAEPNLIFYTHCHPDHFSQELTQQALERWPFAEAVLPERRFSSQILLSRPRQQLSLAGLSARFIRLPHEGEQYADVAHYGCLLEYDGFRVLIPGDCAVASPVLREFLEEVGPVDLALVDFPWITLSKGRRFLQQFIRPKHLAVFHLPFEKDDIYGYRRAVHKTVEQLPAGDLRVFLKPLQREVFDR